MAMNVDGNMPYDVCTKPAVLKAISAAMADAGITQDLINEKRSEPERQMLSDMKSLHQDGVPLKEYRSEKDGSTYVSVRFLRCPEALGDRVRSKTLCSFT